MKTAQMTLPKVKIVVSRLADPKFVPVRVDGKTINMDEYHLKDVELEVEVLTVHIEKNKMRVRYPAPFSGKTADISADAFFNKFQITEKA